MPFICMINKSQRTIEFLQLIVLMQFQCFLSVPTADGSTSAFWYSSKSASVYMLVL